MAAKTMLMFSSIWKTELGDKPTFKMMPSSMDCPYNEVIYDPENKVLAVVGKEKKQAYRMVPKLDDKGRPVEVRTASGMSYAQERKIMENFYEYYIDNVSDIETFINMFALNADFDWKRFL